MTQEKIRISKGEISQEFLKFVEGFTEQAGVTKGPKSRELPPKMLMVDVLASWKLDCGKQEDWGKFLEDFENDHPGFTARGNPDLCRVTLRDWLKNHVRKI